MTMIASGIIRMHCKSVSATVWRPRHSLSAIGTGLVESSLDGLAGVGVREPRWGSFEVSHSALSNPDNRGDSGVMERLFAEIRDELRRLQSLQSSALARGQPVDIQRWND
jgi:hypothetical protein